MAIRPPQAGMDRTELAEILAEFQDVLPTALEEHEEWFVEGMPAHLREAWPYAQSRITSAIQFLNDPPNPELLDAQLADVGLTEPESVPKKQGILGALGRLVSAPSKPALKSVLGWMNIILGSLSGLVPGIEGVKEYKESCEQALEDSDLKAEAADASEPSSPRPPKTRGEFKL